MAHPTRWRRPKDGGRLGPLRRFARDESGGVTVEAVLWLPFFFALLILVTDVSLVFYGKAQAYRLLEAGNRARASGRLASAAATATWIEAAYDDISPSADATTTELNGVITTRFVIPANELMMFASLTSFSGFTMTIRAQQFMER